MNASHEEPLSPTQKVSQIKRAHQAELMAKANVVGVGVGYRQVAGERTKTASLVVMVSRKLPAAQLEPKDLLPTEIEGVPVDVQEVGELKAL
jgi:hypothetical protein